MIYGLDWALAWINYGLDMGAPGRGPLTTPAPRRSHIQSMFYQGQGPIQSIYYWYIIGIGIGIGIGILLVLLLILVLVFKRYSTIFKRYSTVFDDIRINNW